MEDHLSRFLLWLNQRHIPAPGATYRRKRPSRHYGTWSASVLHGDLQQATGMLSNPVYIGRVIWNRREWLLNPETKRRVPRLRPVRVSRNVVEERCLAALRDELLTPDAVERIIQKATRLLATRNRERQPELERTRGPESYQDWSDGRDLVTI